MILRGVFLARRLDMDWFLSVNGVSRIYPELWQQLQDNLPDLPGGTMLERFCEAVFSADVEVAKRAVGLWQAWSGQVALGNDYQESLEAVNEKCCAKSRWSCTMPLMIILSPKIRCWPIVPV